MSLAANEIIKERKQKHNGNIDIQNKYLQKERRKTEKKRILSSKNMKSFVSERTNCMKDNNMTCSAILRCS